MAFSETIVAAAIGAMATIVTAFFQLYSAWRSKGSAEVPQKRGRTFRSIVAIAVLMIASGVSGFMYSEFRQQDAIADLRSMRQELNANLRAFAASTERLAVAQEQTDQLLRANARSVLPARSDEADIEPVKSAIYSPSCMDAESCTEANGQRTSLCGALPPDATVTHIERFVAEGLWTESEGSLFVPQPVQPNQDLGGAKFISDPVEHHQSDGQKSVCVDFVHWSARPHIAHVVFHYQKRQVLRDLSTTASPTTVAAAPALLPSSQPRVEQANVLEPPFTQ